MLQQIKKPILISIVGPTAVGKTALAIKIANKLHTEIISADSRQFFREMEIGTAKPSEEELSQATHHFINSHSITEQYNAGQYGRDAQALLVRLFQRYKTLVAVGGSTLYLKALWEGFDEMPVIKEGVREALNKILKADGGLGQLQEELKEKDPDYYKEVDLNNGQRLVRALEVIRSTGEKFSTFRKAEQKELPYENLKIGLDMDRALLFDRIDQRMDSMIAAGLFEEAKALYPYKDHNALQTVGYSEIFGFMDGEYDREEAVRLLKRNSRRYAKRQLTWFRKYEDIHWFEPGQEEDIFELLERKLDN